MEPFAKREEMCPHCRAEHAHVLGTCSVCGRVVCDECGNIQYTGGERKVVHRECLRDSGDDGFTMIKFVR